MTHRDPLERGDLLPVDETIPPYSFNPAPYRWMREEHFRDVCEAEGLNIPGPTNPRKERGWVSEPDRQAALLQHFWGKLEKGRSLVFFYVNQGNPLDETASRILVGAGRIADMGPQLYFSSRSGASARYPVWSRRITHAWPEEGVLLPYQAYLRNGWSVSEIVCRVPPGSLSAFKYVGEHVTDDVAVGCLERLIQSVEAVKKAGKVPGDWDHALAWLSRVLEEVWSERGPYPGLGPLLHFLGFDQGMAWMRTTLAPRMMKGEDVWPEVKTILDSKTGASAAAPPGLRTASTKWKKFSAATRKLLETLILFELSSDQIERLADPARRKASGVMADEDAIRDNPYLLAEQDWGTPKSETVSVDEIDRGLLPDGVARTILRARGYELPANDDPRRVRAVALQVLRDAAAEGHTLLSLGDLLTRVERYFPEHRVCRVNADLFKADADFHREALALHVDTTPPVVALPELERCERELAEIIRRRMTRSNPPCPPGWSWERLLAERFDKDDQKASPGDDAERRARAEKVRALEILYESRFSVLAGRAGTGKTSVLSVFLDGLEQLHGKRDVLLLAPTGKARVRLSTLTRRTASTIHQFLLRQRWFDPELFHLKQEGGEQAAAPTVIIDEASMIPMDLLGVLFRALDLNKVERLVLVGDPNQLPPIGPGRPFVDIIAWLESDPERSRRLARLTERVRQKARQEDSLALRLSDGYLRGPPNPGDDEILSLVARGQAGGDLEVHFWQDMSELRTLLSDRLEALLGLPQDATDDKALNRSLGGDAKEWQRAESWQILSPTRQQPYGTDALNREIQAKYKANRLRWAREWGGRWYNGRRQCRPFGEQEIVWLDKVIQIVNRARKAWPRRGGSTTLQTGKLGWLPRHRRVKTVIRSTWRSPRNRR
ncbi:MAG: AAA family ATPase [Armatimonadota bacterium]|nr:AAA family ATPase [Armatimonadota bacterium]MDR7543049.1 AAA family ATPase [Armatimonadota bacterium]